MVDRATTNQRDRFALWQVTFLDDRDQFPQPLVRRDESAFLVVCAEVDLLEVALVERRLGLLSGEDCFPSFAGDFRVFFDGRGYAVQGSEQILGVTAERIERVWFLRLEAAEGRSGNRAVGVEGVKLWFLHDRQDNTPRRRGERYACVYALAITTDGAGHRSVTKMGAPNSPKRGSAAASLIRKVSSLQDHFMWDQTWPEQIVSKTGQDPMFSDKYVSVKVIQS